MSMDFAQFKKVVERNIDLAEDYENFLRQFLLQMGLRTLGQAKALTPKDLGQGGGLISKWELSDVYRSGEDLYIILSNSAEYASHVEDGHMQHERFLPIHYLEQSPHGRQLASQIRSKYGKDAKGVMLQEKWIPGYHMARISMNKIEKELPKRLSRQFEQFMKSKGLA